MINEQTETRGTAMASEKLKILFLCTGNSCRSQMAEGWAKKLKADRVEAWSAGTAAGGLIRARSR